MIEGRPHDLPPRLRGSLSLSISSFLLPVLSLTRLSTWTRTRSISQGSEALEVEEMVVACQMKSTELDWKAVPVQLKAPLETCLA